MKSKNIKILITLAVIVLFAAGCGNKNQFNPPEDKKDDSTANQTDQVKHKVLSFNLEGLNEKGKKKWDVNGESAEAVSANEVKLKNIVAKTYGEEGEATITAEKGLYDRSKNNVVLQNNVKATIENSEKFAGNMLDIQAPQKNAAGAVKKDNVPDKKEKAANSAKTKTVITCDGEVEFNYEHNKAYFTKNVKVTNEDGSIDADKMTVNMDPATKKVKEIVAEGNVKIVSRGDNVAYSDKATYTESEKKVVLSGQPRLVVNQQGEFEAKILGK